MCLITEHAHLKEKVKVLEEKLNPIQLQPVGDIGILDVSAILTKKLKDMGDMDTVLNLADSRSRLYKKEDVQKLCKLSETALLTYVPEDMDCDNFAGVMYGEFCLQKAFPGGIIDSYTHRFNWFIDENKNLWFIEPQTRTMSRELESWEGWKIKFFLS